MGIDPLDTCRVSVGNAEVIIAAEVTLEYKSVGLVVYSLPDETLVSIAFDLNELD